MTRILDDALDAPFTNDVLLQVRTGKARSIHGTAIKSGIYKSAHSDAVKVTKLGVEGDEHVYEAHGGLEKAVHHYCARHYPTWSAEVPNSARHFKPGAFGENLVSSVMNEYNVCIGDVVAMGSEVVLQVTEPRQPCFKLNHRFEFKNMSKRTQESGRTGWYYRVLKEGRLSQGDQIALIERPNPYWTLANIQHYLYKEMQNENVMRELVELPALGEEPRGIFRNRLLKRFEDQQGRLLGDTSLVVREETWSDFKVVRKKKESSTVTSFLFEALHLSDEPTEIQPGSHVRIRLGDTKLTRAYSVVSGRTDCFELGIALAHDSRGGSSFLHNNVHTGDIIPLGKVTQSLPLSPAADKHIFIAGGIGITAFIAHARQLTTKSAIAGYELHLAVKVTENMPFAQHLASLGANLTLYDKSLGQRLDVNALLAAQQSENTHVYCCGPTRLMDGVRDAAIAHAWSPSRVHFEAFAIATSGDAFTAEVASTKQVLTVGPRQSLLEALRSAGLEVASSCEVGHCGTCVVDVRSGKVEHRGTGLVEVEVEVEERGEGNRGRGMLSCVSRGRGHVVLDL